MQEQYTYKHALNEARSGRYQTPTKDISQFHLAWVLHLTKCATDHAASINLLADIILADLKTYPAYWPIWKRVVLIKLMSSEQQIDVYLKNLGDLSGVPNEFRDPLIDEFILKEAL